MANAPVTVKSFLTGCVGVSFGEDHTTSAADGRYRVKLVLESGPGIVCLVVAAAGPEGSGLDQVSDTGKTARMTPDEDRRSPPDSVLVDLHFP